jgi:hypothetical protein
MFNYVNRNPFGQKIESAVSTGQNQQQKQEQQQDDEDTRYLEEDDNDEVSISKRPELTEEDVIFLTEQYISKLKSENEGNDKVQKKLDKFLEKFNVKRFMKQNPNMTASDFHMIMFNETSGLVN